MPDTMREGLLFLISTVFNAYLYLLIIRLVLVWVGANYFNPLTQFIVKCTDIFVKPLRKLIPNIRHVETATLVLILSLQVIKFLLISTLNVTYPAIQGVFIIALGDTLKLLIQTFVYAIILQALMSWIQPASPINYTLYQFTSPIMRPVQRFVPTIGGFDISPIPAIILLQLLLIILVNPILSFGLGIAFG